MTRPTGIGADNATYVRPFGSASEGAFEVAITTGTTEPVAPWQHTRLRVATLEPGQSARLDAGDDETLVVPLAGSVDVQVTDADGTLHEVTLAGRVSVFDGPTDLVYAGRGSVVAVRNTTGGTTRVALAGAPARHSGTPHPYQYLAARNSTVEHRGAGVTSRVVRALGMPQTLDADSLLVCEVITPAGHWSSWPPHKHDTHRPGQESELEEIYYIETRCTDPYSTNPSAADPIGYLRVYGTHERPIDVLAEVRSGDVVLVPHGWHGPAIAAPNADLYYLNVMAGPGPERVWLICEDPAHCGGQGSSLA